MTLPACRLFLLALLSPNLALLSPALAAATPAAAATLAADPQAASAWSEAPLETLDDGHRVREGHVAPAEAIAADAREAAAGHNVGATAAHAVLLGVDAEDHAEAPNPSSDGVTLRSGRDRYVEATWIADVGVLLRGDTDGDRFFGAVELSIDVDTESVEREVYAAIDLIEPDGTLTVSHVTRNFTVRGNSSNDAYRVEIELLDNHFAGERDVYIEIRDSWSGTLLDSVSPFELASLAALPLESERPFRPVRDDGPHPDGGSDYALGVLLTGSGNSYSSGSYSSGSYASTGYASDSYVAGYAGSAGPLGALVLLGAALGRRRSRDVARRERNASL